MNDFAKRQTVGEVCWMRCKIPLLLFVCVYVRTVGVIFNVQTRHACFFEFVCTAVRVKVETAYSALRYN